MHVYVADSLAPELAGIDHQAKALLSAAIGAQLRGDGDQARRQRRFASRQIGDRCVMRNRDYERMRRRLGVEVLDRDHVNVPENGFCGHLAGGDLAEDAVIHQRPRIVKVQDFVVVFPARSATRTVTRTGPFGYSYEGMY